MVHLFLKNKISISVESLEDINKALTELAEEDYQTIKNSIQIRKILG